MNSKSIKHFCILCGQSTVHTSFYQKLKKCSICSLVSADEIPDKEKLGSVYERNYFFEGEYLNYLEEKETLQKNFKKWVSLLRRFAPHGRLFEIGSAYGFFLELAREYWEAKGMDISEEACNYAKGHGHDVECGDFLDIPVESEKYNIFCLWDTIEHLKTPHLYLKKIGEVIAPEGIVCLTTGDIDAVVPRMQKEKWRMIHPPTHLYYFSKKTLAALLEKNHFEIVHTSYVGFYRNIKRVLYNLGSIHRQTEWQLLYSWYNRLGLKDFSFYLNLYDILLVIARKRP